MFVSILLLLGFSAPLRGGAVTLSTGAESLPLILDQLSPYSGTPLKIRPTFKDEIGYLDVKEMPIDEVKTRLATVFHATWEAKSDGEYLTRDATIANAERKEELARYGTAFHKAFLDQTRSVPSYKWTDANAIGQLRDLAAANSRTRQQYCLPVGQLFLKLISSMDFTELASNPVQETFVYATAPNRNQKALPSSAGKLLDEFLDEHASLVSALESNPKESRLAGLAHVFEGNYTAVPNLPAKIVMRVMQTDRARIHFKMSIYDRDGYRISWMQMPFLVDPAPLAADSLPAMDRWGSKPLPDSDVAQAARLALGNTASILPGADRPDLHDPLGIALNDALKAVGSEANLQVVGRLPDAAAASTIYRDPDETLSGFWREFMASTRADIDGKVLMLQPRYSQMAYEDRIRRQPLAQLFQTIGNGLPSLANLFTYVSNQRPGPSSLVELMAFGDYGIGLNNMQGMSILPRSKDSRAMIRLVGSMSRARSKQWRTERWPFPTSRLPSGQIGPLSSTDSPTPSPSPTCLRRSFVARGWP